MWSRTSINGINRLKMRKVSIILMYAVLGRELDTLIKSVVRTKRVVTFTVTMDSNSFACMIMIYSRISSQGDGLSCLPYSNLSRRP